MSILIGSESRVIVQGITGNVGSFHTLRCINYALGKQCYVAGVHPKKGGNVFHDLPIFSTVKEAKEKTNANTSVIYVPALRAKSAILEAVTANVELIVCITEGIPVNDMLLVKSYMANSNSASMLLGPNCPGLIVPEVLKVGIMPEDINKHGKVGIVSRSGTLTYEAVEQVSAIGLGQSTSVGIGGDPINGLKHIDVLKLFNDDLDTDAVIMIGEIGGNDEVIAAKWASKNMTKPVVGFIAGISAPPGKRMGHAGALISDGHEKALTKLKKMEEAGMVVTKNPTRMGQLVAGLLNEKKKKE